MDRYWRCGHCNNKRILKSVQRLVEELPPIAGLTARSTRFNSRAEICTLCSQTYSFSTTPHFWLYLPNAEMTLDLEVNEVEVKVLTSLASVTAITGGAS